MAEFFCMLTDTGKGLLANAVALGTQMRLTHMAIGDGGGPGAAVTEAMDALAHEVHRAPLNDLVTIEGDPYVVKAEMVIPPDVGGWTVREAGLFTNTGVLFAVALMPESYKPALADGSTMELRVRMLMEVTNAQAASIELTVDPSVVLASREFVEAKVLEVRGVVDAHTARKDNPHGVAWPQIGGKPAAFPPEAHEHPWSGITGKPGTFPPEEHNHDSRYYTGPESNARYLGKTERAADSSKLEGRTKAQVVAEAKQVSLKGTRTTDGTWTLTGLTIGVPVYLAYRPNHTSTSNTQYVKFSVISGSQNQLRPSGNQSTQFILAAEISDADNGTGGSAVIIPNSTTLKLNISSIGTGETVAAYQ